MKQLTPEAMALRVEALRIISEYYDFLSGIQYQWVGYDCGNNMLAIRKIEEHRLVHQFYNELSREKSKR